MTRHAPLPHRQYVLLFESFAFYNAIYKLFLLIVGNHIRRYDTSAVLLLTLNHLPTLMLFGLVFAYVGVQFILSMNGVSFHTKVGQTGLGLSCSGHGFLGTLFVHSRS